MLAEIIIQGPDTVQATWLLPVVTGTDLGSLKQKGNSGAGYQGLRDPKGSARTGLESRYELRQHEKAKNHKAQQLSCNRMSLA